MHISDKELELNPTVWKCFELKRQSLENDFIRWNICQFFSVVVSQWNEKAEEVLKYSISVLNLCQIINILQFINPPPCRKQANKQEKIHVTLVYLFYVC